MKLFLYITLFTLTLLSCNQSKVQTENQPQTNENLSEENSKDLAVKDSIQELKEDQIIDPEKLTKAYFASGCFWCVEAIYESIRGVQEVYNGYSGGFTKNPTYESSNTGKTGHAEAIEVVYDSSIVSFNSLVQVYFGTQNIEQINGQGNDRGSQYRSIIFYSDSTEKAIIDKKIAELKAAGKKPAAEVKEFEKFWLGEDYHQNYEKLHPNQAYIISVSVPRLNRFKEKFPELLKTGE